MYYRIRCRYAHLAALAARPAARDVRALHDGTRVLAITSPFRSLLVYFCSCSFLERGVMRDPGGGDGAPPGPSLESSRLHRDMRREETRRFFRLLLLLGVALSRGPSPYRPIARSLVSRGFVLHAFGCPRRPFFRSLVLYTVATATIPSRRSLV